MSSQSYSQLQYPLSDFVESGGVVSPVILKQELTDAGLSVTVNSVSVSDTVVNMFFFGMVLAADVTLVDAVVAAHTGDTFQPKYQREVSEVELTNDTTTDVEKVSMDTGALEAGNYVVSWYAELCVTSVVAGTGASGGLNATKNGGSIVEVGRSVNDLSVYTSLSGSYTLLDVKDGEHYAFALVFKRLGASSNPAKMRRARIFLTPGG